MQQRKPRGGLRQAVAAAVLLIVALPCAAQVSGQPSGPQRQAGENAAQPQPTAAAQPSQASARGQATTPPITSAAIPDTPLQPGDVVAITVVDEPRLTGQFRIRADGNLNLPLLGMVHAAGLTPTQLEDVLTRLCKKYLVKPVVSVVPVRITPRLVSVLGHVMRPGTYDIRQCPTVLALLAAAGGPATTGDLSKTVIIRGDKRISLKVDNGVPRDMKLEPGDAVYVPPRLAPIVYVMGAVRQPGPQPMTAATTASRAVVLAGGPTDAADLSGAFILREGKRIAIDLQPFFGGGNGGKDTVLKAGDVVVVPLREQPMVYVLGAVSKPGSYPIREGQLASQIIAMAGGVTQQADLKRAFLLRRGERIHIDLEGLLREGASQADVAVQAGDAVVVPAKEEASFYVIGQVKNPGMYRLVEGQTVLDAWSVAGGALEDADIWHCVLIHEDGSSETINMDALVNGGDVSQNVELKPGDRLVVPRAQKMVYVLGQVLKPGPQPYREGESLMDVLGRAGGPTALANINAIAVIRREVGEGEKPEQRVRLVDLSKVQEGNAAYAARPGDVIYVPAVREARRRDYLQWILSTVSAVLVGVLAGR